MIVRPKGGHAQAFSTAEVFDLDDDMWSPVGDRSTPMRLEFDDPGPTDRVEMVARIDDDYTLRVELLLDEDLGVYEGRIVFDPAPHVRSRLGARHLRKLGYQPLLDEAMRWVRQAAAAAELGAPWRTVPQNPGRAGKADEDYLEIAQRYVAACENEEFPRRPIDALLDEEERAGRVGATKAQMAGQVKRARQRGLITSTRQGEGGGRLTEKALKMIAALEPRRVRDGQR